MTNLLRLATLSLLFVYLPVFGVVLFYFVDVAPFQNIAALNPALTPQQVLDPLDEGRIIQRSFPLHRGFDDWMIEGERREYLKGSYDESEPGDARLSGLVP